jgi:hypothetical protein
MSVMPGCPRRWPSTPQTVYGHVEHAPRGLQHRMVRRAPGAAGGKHEQPSELRCDLAQVFEALSMFDDVLDRLIVYVGRRHGNPRTLTAEASIV